MKKSDRKPISLIVGIIVLIASALLILLALERRAPDVKTFQGPSDYVSPTTPPPGYPSL